MIGFFRRLDAFILEGQLPERALLRLRRAQVSLYFVKKIEKNRILFHVNSKDSEKVFAIFRNVCYNSNVYTPYTVKSLGAVGAWKYIERVKRRVGFLLGGLLCVFLLGVSQPLVLSVDTVGTDVYERGIRMTLEEAGITPFAPYKKGREDWVIAKLLTLPDVEYVSLKKVGYRLLVETRLSPFPSLEKEKGEMYADHSGTLVGITVMRGTPLKKIGDFVKAGESIVSDRIEVEGGGQVRVEIIARVRIACTHEGIYPVETEEEAFAKAYLALGEEVKIIQKRIEKQEGGFYVKLQYEVVESKNF